MIPININVKEGAYDKIIYFLSHFKDDVIIIDKPNEVKKNLNKKTKEIKKLERLAKLDKLVAQSNNKIKVTREIAINTDEITDDIS